eukprot:scaffold186509_cov31-Tisochrysis_lutea.AAC.1
MKASSLRRTLFGRLSRLSYVVRTSFVALVLVPVLGPDDILAGKHSAAYALDPQYMGTVGDLDEATTDGSSRCLRSLMFARCNYGLSQSR